MKKILMMLFLFCSFIAKAQNTIPATDTLKIVGKIKLPLTYTINTLDTFSKTSFADITIVSPDGKNFGTIRNLKGVLLKDIFKNIEIPVSKPKYLNEYYFVFIASDGYKVVFSWNEIFNNESGDHFYIITEMEGKKLKEIDSRISMISTKDFVTGRRYIQGLQKIIVNRID